MALDPVTADPDGAFQVVIPHAYAADGTYQPQVKVANRWGEQASDSLTVVVNDPIPPNHDPVIEGLSVSPDSGWQNVTEFTFCVTATDEDDSATSPSANIYPDGDAGFFFTVALDPAGENTYEGCGAHTYAEVGAFTGKVRVFDGDGGQSAFADFSQVTVTATHALEVVVTDFFTGAPLSDIRGDEGSDIAVTVLQEGSPVVEGVTDATGTFTVLLPAGTYTADVSDGGDEADPLDYLDMVVPDLSFGQETTLPYRMIPNFDVSDTLGWFNNFWEFCAIGAMLGGGGDEILHWNHYPLTQDIPEFTNGHGLDYDAAAIAQLNLWAQMMGIEPEDLYTTEFTGDADCTYDFTGSNSHTNYDLSGDFVNWTIMYVNNSKDNQVGLNGDMAHEQGRGVIILGSLPTNLHNYVMGAGNVPHDNEARVGRLVYDWTNPVGTKDFYHYVMER